MKKEVTEKWVKALRSGEYKQTTKVLQDDAGYCCLGVLCDLAEKEGVSILRSGDTVTGETLDQQLKVKRWAGLRTSVGCLTKCKADGECLSRLNDKGSTFPEIADIIEKHWEEL